MRFLSVPKDNELKVRQDKEKEIRRLMDDYGDDVMRTAFMYLKNRQTAEDAFQEVFLKIYGKLDSFKHESSEKTWIITIAMNVCRDMLRSSWLKRVLLTDKLRAGKSVSDIEGSIIKKDDGKMLFEEVLALPPAFKEVVILYYYQNYDTQEISKILKVAEGTVRSRLFRAREILKTKLGGRLSWGDQT